MGRSDLMSTDTEQNVRQTLETGVEERISEDMPIGELRMRLSIVTKVLIEARDKRDKRWKNLIPQQRRLNDALVKKIKEERRAHGKAEIEPTVINMQSVKLTTRAAGFKRSV